MTTFQKKIVEPKSGMEKLQNAVLDLLHKLECSFTKRIGTVGKSFITSLFNILWYIDGHHLTIERESIRKIPVAFRSLQGYNRPEVSKHRKREASNLTEKKLSSLSINLKEVVQCMKFIETGNWVEFRISALQLANSEF